MPYPAALEAGRKGTQHLVPFSNSGTDPSSLRTFFHGDNIGAFNWSRVNDPQVNHWLDEAQALSKPEERSSRLSRRPAPGHGPGMDPADPRPGEPERGVGTACRA